MRKLRLIIVSNRLPVTLQHAGGHLSVKSSGGGLASSISSFIEKQERSKAGSFEYIWLGWPGIKPKDSAEETAIVNRLKPKKSIPIFLSKDQIKYFYNGFCNESIWPLFHQLPQFYKFKEKYFEQYKNVNKLFFKEIRDEIRPDDLVFIQDYHLMLLPKLLRDGGISNPISFFLHTPFPCYGIFQMLSKEIRKNLLEGILGSNLAGFQTEECKMRFFEAVKNDLGYKTELEKITGTDIETVVKSFPIGIDFNKFYSAKTDTVDKKNGVVELASVDRLDYTKGIINRLLAFEQFLKNSSKPSKKIILNLVVVPSRTSIKSYKFIKKQIDDLVNRINKKFAYPGFRPIKYFYKQLGFDELLGIYRKSQVAIITPFRDGMNLVAKEFIASKRDKKGSLILSEFAGSANELKEAIIINPNNTWEISQAINRALNMSIKEQKRRVEKMQKTIKQNNVAFWMNQIIKTTIKASFAKKTFGKIFMYGFRKQIIKEYALSLRRLILLDYDGTLVPHVDDPNPVLSKPDNEILNIINKLVSDKKNDVAIVSGRDKRTLNRFFNIPNLGLVAEHGVWAKRKGKWKKLSRFSSSWKSEFLPYLKTYSENLSGTIIENKSNSIAFHFRQADQDASRELTAQIVMDLLPKAYQRGLQILFGNKVIEIKCLSINKGIAAGEWLGNEEYDFILAIGDDTTDEDLFNALPSGAYSVKVGFNKTSARYNLAEVAKVRKLLKSFTIADSQHVNINEKVINNLLYRF